MSEMPAIVGLESAEFDDHRMIFICTRWIKMFYQHETGVTHVILGDGYQNEGFPVECIPVLNSVGDLYKMLTGSELYDEAKHGKLP